MSYEKLRSDIKKYSKENHIMGMLRVTVRDKIVFEQNMGYADYENGIEFSEDSLFSFYSLSKPFCAIGFMKLVETGGIDLYAHPSKYIPEAAEFDPRANYYHLMHHISGLPDYSFEEEFAKNNAPGYPRYIREHTRLLAKLPSYFAPGEGKLYSNVGFVLPALTIENVTGMSYADYMKKEVFDPMGMKTAFVDPEPQEVPNRVKGYDLVDGKLVHVQPAYDWLMGAGDIVGTVDDVYRLNLAVKHKLILKESTWERIFERPPITNMGLGCRITEWHNKIRITHNGGHVGFRTLHIHLPEDDFDIILLSNSGFGDARNEISEMVHSAFYGEDSNLGEVVEMDKGYI